LPVSPPASVPPPIRDFGEARQEIQIQPPASPSEASSEGGSFMDKLKIHKIKIMAGIFAIFVALGIFLAGFMLGQKKIVVELLGPKPISQPTLMSLVSPTPIPETAPSPAATSQLISIPKDWQEYTATDPEFGIKTTLSLPPEFSFSFTGSEFTIQSADGTELWDYSTSVFPGKDGLKNYYTGESRRDWYQKLLDGEFWTEKPYQFVGGKITNAMEHQIGPQTYLELTVTGGPPSNYSREVGTHFIYAQNGIIHIIKPASHKANSATAQLPNNIGIVFYSLKSSRIK